MIKSLDSSNYNKADDDKQLDYSKPIYTRRYAVICPAGILFSRQENAEAIQDAFVGLWHQKEAQKELGCEEWHSGIRIYVSKPEPSDSFVDIGVAPDRIGLLITKDFDLTNDPAKN